MAYVGLGDLLASLRTGSFILGSMGLGWFSSDSCVPGVTLEDASICHTFVGATFCSCHSSLGAMGFSGIVESQCH